MNGTHQIARKAYFSVFLCVLPVLLTISVCAAKEHALRINLFPRLHAGENLTYQISYHSDKHVTTNSSVIVAIPDDAAKIDITRLLHLEVLGVQAQGDRAVIHARTSLEALGSDTHFKVPQAQATEPQIQRQDAAGKSIEFTILPDGRLDHITGLEPLFPEQQQAWQEWASRFLLAAELRTPTVRIAQKWTSEEAEKSPSPIAGLRWIRESTYVRDEPCHPVQLTSQGGAASSDDATETCAVILTNATLRQDSNAKNTTPEDFKLHELRTTGTASGSNRIITYISLQTGLLVRATEEAAQQMDVTVAKADGSNRVHYRVNAKSRSEVLRVSETPIDHP
jgi:hypothetical protein